MEISTVLKFGQIQSTQGEFKLSLHDSTIADPPGNSAEAHGK